MMGRYEPAAAGSAVVTAADTVAGHVTLDNSCLDRVYLNGFTAKLQTPGGWCTSFTITGASRSCPRRCSSRWGEVPPGYQGLARANGVPLIRFKAGERGLM